MELGEIKNWSPDIEKGIVEKWKESESYRFDKKSKKKIYSIDTPPPYVNAPIHIGQAVTYCYMDFFARYKRMKGFDVLFPLGLDRNGLPIEMAAEKKFGVKLTSTPREKFLELCEKVLQESSIASEESFLRLGISFNSWKIGNEIGDAYLTDSPEYRALTQETFIQMWDDNLIYEDERINNWCPGCQTTLADAEVEYKDFPSFFNDIIFAVKETGEKIIIGTTRPELIATCGMIIFHPDDGLRIAGSLLEMRYEYKRSGLLSIWGRKGMTDIAEAVVRAIFPVYSERIWQGDVTGAIQSF